MVIVKIGILFAFFIQCIHCQNEKFDKVQYTNDSQMAGGHTNFGHYVLPNSNSSKQRYPAYDYPKMIGQCGGVFRNIQNLIESPKFISARPICNLRCEYQIISPYICENEFHVQFLNFSLDPTPNCVRDEVIMNHVDILCGNVMGVRKYRTVGGVLNVTFLSNSWDSVGKGFRLLITRLPCVGANRTEVIDNKIDSYRPPAENNDNNHGYYDVTASYPVADPSYDDQPPIYGVSTWHDNSTDIQLDNRQDIPVIPLPTPSTTLPPIQTPPFIPPPLTTPSRPIYPPPVTLPPPILPQCCRNVYNQQRFLMLSQGFPAHGVLYNDCIYVIHKSSSNACRLRIHFKYFLLDDVAQQQGQLGCINNFIEVDGQRICGCKTNFIYETQWGLEPKVIRLRTIPGKYPHPQGFIFDVEQMDCPLKVQAVSIRQKRTLLTTKLLLHPLLRGHSNDHSISLQYPQPTHHNIDPDERFLGRFYQPNSAFINSVCSLNYLKLIQLKIESFGIMKHFCLPLY